jgi:hypothetical protein
MEYVLVTATGQAIADSKKLNEAVNDNLRKGYELYGSPGLFIDSKEMPVYYQAMTKTQKEA